MFLSILINQKHITIYTYTSSCRSPRIHHIADKGHPMHVQGQRVFGSSEHHWWMRSDVCLSRIGRRRLPTTMCPNQPDDVRAVCQSPWLYGRLLRNCIVRCHTERPRTVAYRCGFATDKQHNAGQCWGGASTVFERRQAEALRTQGTIIFFRWARLLININPDYIRVYIILWYFPRRPIPRWLRSLVPVRQARNSLCQTGVSIKLWPRRPRSALLALGTGTGHIPSDRSQVLSGKNAMRWQWHVRIQGNAFRQLARHSQQC